MMATNGKNNKRGAKPGTSSDGVVAARAFRLLDDDGNVRAELSLNKAGQPDLRLMDHNGKVRMVAGLGPRGDPSVALYDKKGICRVVVHTVVGEDGSTGVSVHDAKGQARAELIYRDDDGEACMHLSDAKGPRAVVTVDAGGWPSLELISKNDLPLFSAALGADFGGGC